jgi:hypothetical protein
MAYDEAFAQRVREIVPELAEAQIENGDFDPAETVLAQALDVAADTGDERLRARTTLERLALDLYRSETISETAIPATRRAITIFERAGDEAGLARAWRLAMFAHGTVDSKRRHRRRSSLPATRRAPATFGSRREGPLGTRRWRSWGPCRSPRSSRNASA